jgi:hypothetical protein
MTADSLLGLLVALPDACKACGSRDAIVGEGRGPHRAALHCRECERHRGWLGAVTHAFLVEVINKFGRPNEAISIQRGDNPAARFNDGCAFQYGKGIGFISDRSFLASSPNTAAQTADRAPLAVKTEDTEAEVNSDGDEKCPWD